MTPKASAPAADETSGAREEVRESGASEIAMLLGRWKDIVEKAAKISIGVRSALKDARPVAFEDGALVVGVDPEFGEAIGTLSAQRNKKAVEHVLKTALKRETQVEFRLVDGVFASSKPAPRAEMTVREEEPVEAPSFNAVGLKNWSKEEAVKSVMEVFNARIVDIRE